MPSSTTSPPPPPPLDNAPLGEGGLLPANEITSPSAALPPANTGPVASSSNTTTTVTPTSTSTSTAAPKPTAPPVPPVALDTEAPTLRTHLLAALATHPGTRTFHLHALVSNPRRTPELFPFATPRAPRVWVQDILVLVSEEALKAEGGEKAKEGLDNGDGRPRTPPPRNSGGGGTGGGMGGRVLTTGILASLFLVPATASGILYISKVDTTGQSIGPSPAALLVRSLIGFYLDPSTRPSPAREVAKAMWVQVFARAQGQYLFSASVEWPKKKPLGDTQLCAWWRKVLGRVAREVRGKVEESGGKMRMRYVLPGMSQEEAEHALRAAGGEGSEGWVYRHPYDGPETDGIGLPCPQPPVPTAEATAEGEGVKRKHMQGINLGCVIPSFDDDPKSRFMDEIAYTTDGEIRSPQRKKARTATGGKSNTEEEKPLGELGKVSADEFWERMSFRQECVAGAVTGFFTVVAGGQEGSNVAVVGGQAGHVSGAMHKRVVTTLLTGVEFSTAERACKATETVEGAIKGLCEAGPADVVGRPAVPCTPPRGRQRTGIVDEEYVLGNYGLIYGAVSTRNAVVGRSGTEGETVRVLAVRRKKKQ